MVPAVDVGWGRRAGGTLWVVAGAVFVVGLVLVVRTWLLVGEPPPWWLWDYPGRAFLGGAISLVGMVAIGVLGRQLRRDACRPGLRLTGGALALVAVAAGGLLLAGSGALAPGPLPMEVES